MFITTLLNFNIYDRENIYPLVTEAAAQRPQRRPLKEVPTKRLLVKRAAQVGRSQPLKRSASTQRSAVIRRPAVIERPAVMYGSASTLKSATGQKPLAVEKSASDQKPVPVERSATSQKSPLAQRPVTLPASETVNKSALKRVAPARDTVAAKKRASPATTESDAPKAVEKEENKKEEVDEKSLEKQYELSPRLSRALELELQRIMIKVWQEFPDNPSTAEEKLVADKFRNEAGDSLRNVLGLNVTERLLNVHNSLYVKLYFKNQPERGTLTNFIRKHNMKTFKRIDNATNMFAAQMATFEDFDRICNATEVNCGRVKVTVKPCYSFTSCPPNLKTIYSGTAAKEQDSTEAKSGVEEKKVTVTNQTVETGRDVKKDIDFTTKDKKLKTEVKAESVKDKTVPVVAIKANVESVEEAKRDKPKTQAVQAVTEKVPSHSTKAPPKSKERAVKRVDKNETISNEKATRQSINIDQMKIIDEYDTIESEEIPERDFDEEEELDDKDILALMAEGIVLDECGSEEE